MDTLTIPLTPDVKARLEEMAEARQLPAPQCALELLVEALRAHPKGIRTTEVDVSGVQSLLPEPARLAAIDEAAGLLAGAPFSVDDFLREKHEETLRAERKGR